MKKMLQSLARDQKGVTAIEYGLIAAFIALALVASLPTVRDNLKTTFGSVADSLKTTP